jgi:hypothetical protein
MAQYADEAIKATVSDSAQNYYTSYNAVLNKDRLNGPAFPQWLNKSGLVELSEEINSPLVWRTMINNLSPELENSLNRIFDLGNSKEEIAEKISENNSSFMGTSLEKIFLGTAIDITKTLIPEDDLTSIVANIYNGPIPKIHLFFYNESKA